MGIINYERVYLTDLYEVECRTKTVQTQEFSLVNLNWEVAWAAGRDTSYKSMAMMVND